MRLFEVANQPYQFALEYNDSIDFCYSFKTEKGNEYEVNFQRDDHYVDPKEGTEVIFTFSNVSENILNKFKITNTGNAFKIFATVKEILYHYVDSVNVDNLYVVFSATEPSRVKLYDKIVHEPPLKLVDTVVMDSKVYICKVVR